MGMPSRIPPGGLHDAGPGDTVTRGKDEIQAALRDFVRRQFPAARTRYPSDTDSLVEQGIIDSMGVLDLVTFIETDFQVTFLEEELVSDHFDSVASIAELVHRKTSERP
jgi:acyl carrier protein